MKKEYLTLPNLVTSIRIFAAIIMLTLKPLSLNFIVVYTIGGFSDAVDGFLARKLNKVSKFGSKLDSVADLSFYSIMMIKLFPTLRKKLNPVIWNCVFVVLICRVGLYFYYAIKKHTLLNSHSLLNKLTGLGMYLLPYSTYTKFLPLFSWLIVLIAFIAFGYELFHVLKKDA